MNSSDKYFWMYDKAKDNGISGQAKDSKRDERKLDRIRKNIERNSASAKPQERAYEAPIPEKSAPSNDYNASSEACRNQAASNPNNGNASFSESLDGLIKKLNQPNSQNPGGIPPVEKIMEEMPNLLMYQAGKMWDEINGVLVEGADPELMGKSSAVADYILGDPKSVVQKVRNDVAGHLLYKGMNLLKQYKEKILGK